jgi:patatin-like phospholipase/acyl hydrolase
MRGERYPVANTIEDGGGIRGLSELIILEEIMERIKGKGKLTRVPIPADRFDLIGGTSTGGYVVIPNHSPF